MKKLSIIIPIYNVEKYLIRCFDSIYSQDIDESLFEVIAVIDGSPDNSLEMTQEYAKSHGNLLVVNKENGGVSSARNKGIELAKGEYIMFVDPDDCLMASSLQKVIDIALPSCADIIIFRAFDERTNTEISTWKDRIDSNISYTGFEVYEKNGTQGYVWGAAYNRHFWLKKQLEFPLGIKNSEDSILFVQCQMRAQRMMFCDICLYRVFSRPESASHDITPDRLTDWFKALKFVKKIKANECKLPIEIAMMDSMNYKIISSIVNNAVRVMGWRAKSFLNEYCIKEYLPISKEDIKRSSLGNRIMKNIINRSFSLFFLLTYLRNK